MTRAESLRSTSVAFTIVPIEKSKRTFVALLRDSDYRRYYSRRPLQAGRGLSTPLIKSQMNDISGAIISYCYYRDGYYVSRGARLLSRSPLSLFLCRSLLSIFLPLASSQASATLSFHLPPFPPPPPPPSPSPVSGNALTVACKESGHCAARKQKPRLRERARISIIEYIPISSGKGR